VRSAEGIHAPNNLVHERDGTRPSAIAEKCAVEGNASGHFGCSYIGHRTSSGAFATILEYSVLPSLQENEMFRKTLFGFILLTAFAFTFDRAVLEAQGRGQGGGRPAGAGQPPTTSQKPTTSHDTGSQDSQGHGGRPTVEQQVTNNPHLTTTLQTLLPGADLKTASAGFKNLGEFVAAAHVSHNLDIPFDQLKAKMTGANGESLGQAIHELKPTVNADAEARKASKEADADIKPSPTKKSSS
jgi:hypothetical protein